MSLEVKQHIAQCYLEATDIINWQHPDIQAKAAQLRRQCNDRHALIRACFEFVRDHINHSVDYQQNPVTCHASAVLKHGTGYCYAKSHLLAALLRACGIPAGFCYQRLLLTDDPQGPFSLHGLNAVWIEEGEQGGYWYRIDPRGNKPGVDAQFTPPVEQLAFALNAPGEEDFPGVYAQPLGVVTQALQRHDDWLQLRGDLPDLSGLEAASDQPDQHW
ncbi:MAG: transglutaminase family protein [Marinobacterium sp.]|nr:transglutaminase family protein [Marinobacterium sp.]